MTFGDDIAGAITELATELGSETFTWKGASVVCVPHLFSNGTTLEVGGFVSDTDWTLHVLKSVFLTADSTLVSVDSILYTSDNGTPHPVAGRKLTFRGLERRILSVDEDASRSFYRLRIITPNK